MAASGTSILLNMKSSDPTRTQPSDSRPVWAGMSRNPPIRATAGPSRYLLDLWHSEKIHFGIMPGQAAQASASMRGSGGAIWARAGGRLRAIGIRPHRDID